MNANAQNTDPGLDSEGPQQLLERGRAAFFSNDFAIAEEALEQFINDYGEAEEVAEAVRIHTPFVAIAKVGNRKFAEAIEWIDRSLTDSKLDFNLSDELKFWRGICLMTEQELVEAQHAFGAYWAEERHNAFKRYEALLLFANLYLQQDFPSEAAEFLAGEIPKFREIAPEAASRAVVLQLYSHIAAGERTKALDLIKNEFPHLKHMTQMISFQTLALRLGSQFIADKDWYSAISCLQRIWTRDKLREHQDAKLAQIDERIEQLKSRPNSQGIIFQLQSIRNRVSRELVNFEAMENFDSSLRLRLASAFQGLGRYREAALIMEDMLSSMPPDPVVESATLAQLQCWMEIQRWPKAIETAKHYEKVFGEEGKSFPTVLFLQAEAHRSQFDYGRAQLSYDRVVDLFPDHELAPKATFMQGFMYLQQDDNDGAQFQFAQVLRKHPQSSLCDDSEYWSGMALSFNKDYAEARDHMRSYLKNREHPKYQKEAIFRIAVTTFSLAEYPESVSLLESFIGSYPGDPLCDEAYLLIGDAWLGEGEIEKGFAAYDQVRPEATRFFEDAWFKKGKAYKLLEDYDKMRSHYTKFIRDFPESNRMPEAVYFVGWTHLNEDEPGKAQKMYWDTIKRYGNNPDMYSVSDLFSALPKVYSRDGDQGREDLMTKLEGMKSSAASAKKNTLALRSAWSKSALLSKTSPQVGRSELLAASKWVNPKKQNPLLTVSCAEALLDAGNLLTAKEMFSEIRKWHPRALQKDRIYAALATIAEQQDEPNEAIEFYERFEKEAGASSRLGEVLVAKARLQKKIGQLEEARATLEKILENEYVGAAQKAVTLLELGRNHQESGEVKKAIVYFERIYVAYGKFAEINGNAYWERGVALEELNMHREALETYQEFVNRNELTRHAHYKDAQKKVDDLVKRFPVEPTELESPTTNRPEEAQ